MGFLATLAEEVEDERRIQIGPKVGEGGTAVVHTLVLRDPQERSRALRYTEGRGLVLKRVAEVNLMCGWIQNVPKIRGMALTPYLKTLETIARSIVYHNRVSYIHGIVKANQMKSY